MVSLFAMCCCMSLMVLFFYTASIDCSDEDAVDSQVWRERGEGRERGREEGGREG